VEIRSRRRLVNRQSQAGDGVRSRIRGPSSGPTASYVHIRAAIRSGRRQTLELRPPRRPLERLWRRHGQFVECAGSASGLPVPRRLLWGFPVWATERAWRRAVFQQDACDGRTDRSVRSKRSTVDMSAPTRFCDTMRQSFPGRLLRRARDRLAFSGTVPTGSEIAGGRPSACAVRLQSFIQADFPVARQHLRGRSRFRRQRLLKLKPGEVYRDRFSPWKGVTPSRPQFIEDRAPRHRCRDGAALAGLAAGLFGAM